MNDETNVKTLETAQQKKERRMEALVEGILEEVRDGSVVEIAAVVIDANGDVMMFCGQESGDDVGLFHVAGLLTHGAQIATMAATTHFADKE